MKRPFFKIALPISSRASFVGRVLALPVALCAACVEVDSRQVLPGEPGTGGDSAAQGGGLSTGGSIASSGGRLSSVGSGGSTSIAGGLPGGAPGSGGHGGAVPGGTGGLASGGSQAGGAAQGGAAQGGHGGAVAQGGATGVCVQLKGDPTQPLIDDLEDGNSQIAQQGRRVGNWFTYNDGASCTETPSPLTQFNPITGGANGSAVAANINGLGCTTWGAGMGFDFNRANGVSTAQSCPYDVGPYVGIAFFAKSATSTSFNVLVPLMTTESATIGGKCTPTTGLCDDHYRKNISSVSPVWTQYKVLFSELKQYGFGVPTSFDPTQTVGIRFEILAGSTATVPYDLSVDQLTFF